MAPRPWSGSYRPRIVCGCQARPKNVLGPGRPLPAKRAKNGPAAMERLLSAFELSANARPGRRMPSGRAGLCPRSERIMAQRPWSGSYRPLHCLRMPGQAEECPRAGLAFFLSSLRSGRSTWGWPLPAKRAKNGQRPWSDSYRPFRPGRVSSSSSVRGQSLPSKRDRARSDRSLPWVWHWTQ